MPLTSDFNCLQDKQLAAPYAETSCTSKIHKVDENVAGMENLSQGTRLTSDGVPPNVHKGLNNVTVAKKITSDVSITKDNPLINKMSHWLKKRARKDKKLPLDRQIESLKEDGDLLRATERADIDISALKKCAPKEKELPLDHQIKSFKEDEELMGAIQRADADISALKKNLELFNRNCSILCP
jgi:hypothetical protein